MVSGRADMRPDAGPEALRHLLLRYAAALSVAESFLDGGFDVVVEDVIIGPVLPEFLALVPAPEFHLVFLDPAAAAIKQREQERDQTAYGPDRWSVSGLQAILREQTDRIGLWLDTTGQTAGQTVDAILADLDASRVRLPSLPSGQARQTPGSLTTKHIRLLGLTRPATPTPSRSIE